MAIGDDRAATAPADREFSVSTIMAANEDVSRVPTWTHANMSPEEVASVSAKFLEQHDIMTVVCEASTSMSSDRFTVVT